jgi:ABC-type transport system involved in cytochrome c biogenesis permease subunit
MITGVPSGRIVAEPDQQPCWSDGMLESIAVSSATQLMRSRDTECARTMLPHTAPLGLYWYKKWYQPL